MSNGISQVRRDYIYESRQNGSEDDGFDAAVTAAVAEAQTESEEF